MEDNSEFLWPSQWFHNSWLFHELFGPIDVHVDVLSLPSQLRVDKRWSYSELLASFLLGQRKKKGMGRKYMGARILFIASYHTALLQRRQAPVWEPNASGAHCIRSTQFHIISEIISVFTRLTFLLAHACLKCQIFWESHKNLKKKIYLFSRYILGNFVSFSQYLNYKGISRQ